MRFYEIVLRVKYSPHMSDTLHLYLIPNLLRPAQKKRKQKATCSGNFCVAAFLATRKLQ